MREKFASSEQGMAALTLVLILMACILIVGLSVAGMYSARARVNGTNVRNNTAEYVAETGLYKFLWGLNSNYSDFFMQNVATYSAYYPEGNGYYYLTEQNNAAQGTEPNQETLTCTGWLANDQENKYAIQATVKEQQFTQNLLFYNNSTNANNQIVNFGTGDTINGNVETNGYIELGGNPTFNGLVESVKGVVDNGSCSPTYNDGSPELVKSLPMPQDDSQLQAYAKNGGLYLVGRTCILIEAATVYYVNYDCNAADSTYHTFVSNSISMSNPNFNGVIYVANASGDGGDTKADCQAAVTYKSGVWPGETGYTNPSDINSTYDPYEKFDLDRGNVFVSSCDSNGVVHGLGQTMASANGAYLTIVAANDLIITGSDPRSLPTATIQGDMINAASNTPASNHFGLSYGRTTFGWSGCPETVNSSTGDDMLGLIATNDVMILQWGWPDNIRSDIQNDPLQTSEPMDTYNYTVGESLVNFESYSNDYLPYNINIEAAVMSVDYSFLTEGCWWDPTCYSSYTGSDPGTGGDLNLNGSLIENYRGTVAVNYDPPFSGYNKNYYYDPRMQYEAPPNFLNPAQTGWGFMTWQKIVPPNPSQTFDTSLFDEVQWINILYQGGAITQYSLQTKGQTLQLSASVHSVVEAPCPTVLYSISYPATGAASDTTIDPFLGLVTTGTKTGTAYVTATSTDTANTSYLANPNTANMVTITVTN